MTILGVLFSSSLVFAKNPDSPACEKLNAATKDLISSHVDYAKAAIDRKCEKLKKKIRALEENLRYFETRTNETDSTNLNKQREECFKKIQKYEDRIYNLKLMKSSAEIIDFTDL